VDKLFFYNEGKIMTFSDLKKEKKTERISKRRAQQEQSALCEKKGL
jgi:hypothetical protein